MEIQKFEQEMQELNDKHVMCQFNDELVNCVKYPIGSGMPERSESDFKDKEGYIPWKDFSKNIEEFVLNEQCLLDTMDVLCIPSLPPEYMENWEEIKKCLKSIRKNLNPD